MLCCAHRVYLRVPYLHMYTSAPCMCRVPCCYAVRNAFIFVCHTYTSAPCMCRVPCCYAVHTAFICVCHMYTSAPCMCRVPCCYAVCNAFICVCHTYTCVCHTCTCVCHTYTSASCMCHAPMVLCCAHRVHICVWYMCCARAFRHRVSARHSGHNRYLHATYVHRTLKIAPSLNLVIKCEFGSPE